MGVYSRTHRGKRMGMAIELFTPKRPSDAANPHLRRMPLRRLAANAAASTHSFSDGVRWKMIAHPVVQPDL